MDTLIDVAEEVVMKIDVAYTVFGEIIKYFECDTEQSRQSILRKADDIYNLMIVVNDYIYDNKNNLQKAIDSYYSDDEGQSNGQVD